MKLRRTTVKKIFSICLLGLGLILLVSGAVAQENYVNHGVAGVKGLHTRAVLPPHDIFSNCGTGCSSYDTASGYYVSGLTGEGVGQTLAVGFTPTQTLTFRFALTPNTNYTSESAEMSAYLLNGTATGGPTTQLAALVQGGTIPDYPTVRVVRYHGRVKVVKGTTYFLCETEPTSDATMLWMLSNSDTTSPFWFQDAGACTGSDITWLNATGSIAPAFKIRAL
jgi:hypothetical protein